MKSKKLVEDFINKNNNIGVVDRELFVGIGTNVPDIKLHIPNNNAEILKLENIRPSGGSW